MANKPPQNKRFEKGEIVYWCHQRGYEYSVHYGMVDEQYHNCVYVDYLEPRERRRVYSDYINGVSINEFQTEERFHKLPKGWTYNTELYQIKHDEFTDEEKNFMFDITNPDNIKEAYNKGFLVERSKIFLGQIETEITKEGWHLAVRYPFSITKKPENQTILCHKLYRTYKEAKKEVDENIEEFIRQSNLTDYEWSVEQIDKNLLRWKNIYGKTDDEVQQYRKWILAQDDVEDIETKIFDGRIQWKIWNKHKKWHDIEPIL